VEVSEYTWIQMSYQTNFTTYTEILQHENKSLVSTNAKLNSLVRELKTKLNNTHKNFKTSQVQLNIVNKSLQFALNQSNQSNISFDFNQFEQLMLTHQSQQGQINNLIEFNDYLIIKLNTPRYRLSCAFYNTLYLMFIIIRCLFVLFTILFVFSFCVVATKRYL
jgi:hypothetical protein